MRVNQPVVDTEVRVPQDYLLVSRTDESGRISFCNEAFVDISGFSADELVGAPHNIVRHPDMPQQAFRDLWATLKAGHSWEGLVKNRTKTGSYYWVRANVTPVAEGGKLVGYVSIRTAPSQAEVAAATVTYAAIRAGDNGIEIRHGDVIRTGLLGRLGRLGMNGTIRVGVGVAFGLVGVGVPPVLARLGLHDAALAVGIMGGLFLVGGVLSGWWMQRRGWRLLETQLAAILQGRLDMITGAPHATELHLFSRLLRGMRARFAFAEQERMELDRRALLQRRAAINDMAKNLEQQSSRLVRGMSEKTHELTAEAQAMESAVGETESGAERAAGSASTATANAESIAAATTELAASIDEITRQTARAGEIVQRAVQGGQHTEISIRSLSDAVERIGVVATMISSIAGQTNLLALNATIEAARAGEAGKGFAVVASEVKTLAVQTARSTEEINQQIGEIRAATKSAVNAVAQIGGDINDISEVTNSIAAAMEQQAVATQEIARSVSESGLAARDASHHISGAARGAQDARQRAVSLRDGAEQVASGVGDMRDALIQAVRMSLREADRRLEPHFACDEPCEIEVDGQCLPVVMHEISCHGVLVSGASTIAVGTFGRLSLTRHGDAAVMVEICDIGDRGAHCRVESADAAPWPATFEAVAGQAWRALDIEQREAA